MKEIPDFFVGVFLLVLLERIEVRILSFGCQFLLLFQMTNALVPAGDEQGLFRLDQDLDVVDVSHVAGTMSDFLKSSIFKWLIMTAHFRILRLIEQNINLQKCGLELVQAIN